MFVKEKYLQLRFCMQSSDLLTRMPENKFSSFLFSVRPLSVKLNQDNKFLSTNHSYNLNCEVIGSRPAPTITWWKGSTQMRLTKEYVSQIYLIGDFYVWKISFYYY